MASISASDGSVRRNLAGSSRNGMPVDRLAAGAGWLELLALATGVLAKKCSSDVGNSAVWRHRGRSSAY